MLFLIVYAQVWISLAIIYLSLKMLQVSYLSILLLIACLIWFTLGVGYNMRLLVIIWKNQQDI